ncbi:MAG TPA: aspartate/glutamate racemase family protein [Verrucomicrobiae bacterium]
MKKLGLIHTSATLVPIFAQLCKDKLPGVETFNIVDDSLVRGIREAGRLTPQISQRVTDYLKSAESAGAAQILVTCSSIGPAVEAGAKSVGVPVLRVDLPMADRAVATGTKVGVIATLQTTLEPTADLITRRASAVAKKITLISKLCDGAFEALMGGDAPAHDAKVASALRELSKQVDVIVLAQASMARVVETLPPEDKRVPILASPAIAIDHLATVL